MKKYHYHYMNVAKLLTWDFQDTTILIIGKPGSGKTWLSEALAKHTGHRVVHTDDYMKYGYKEALYVLLDELAEETQPIIIEGVQGYRLLRKGVELDCFYPDVVIEVIAPDEQIARVYAQERPDKNVKALAAFNKMHETIFMQYKEMFNQSPPDWIAVENIF